MPDLWLPRRSRREFLRVAGAAGAAAAWPWPPAHAQSAASAFEAVAAARSGITWVHDNAMSEFRYLPETCGSGCAFLDYDGDGWMDIYLVNSGPADIYTPKTPIRNALYRNNRDGTFTDVTEKAGVPGGTFGMGVAVGDFDNDGFPDLFVTAYGNCTLYRNNGNGTFTDVTDKAGLRVPGWTTSAVWFDYDNDGRLDLFVCSFVEFSLATNVYCGDNKLGRRYYCIPRVFKPSASFLFHNNGDGTFTDVTKGTDIQRALGKGLGVVASDLNNDGQLDLFVANDTVQNFLFMNRGGGKWEEIGLSSEVGFSANGQPRSGMGVDAADFDQDGWEDLFVANVDQEMFSLYKNRGNESFQDVAHANGVAQSTRLLSGWGLKFFDYDNDGHLDLMLANGHPDDMIEHYSTQVTYKEPLLLFHNEGGKLRDVSAQAAVRPSRSSTPRAVSRWATWTTTGASTCSSTTTATRPRCSTTAPAANHHWVGLSLQGVTCNRDAIGARLSWSVGGKVTRRFKTGGRQLPLVARPTRGPRARHRHPGRLGGDRLARAQHAGRPPHQREDRRATRRSSRAKGSCRAERRTPNAFEDPPNVRLRRGRRVP